MTSPQRSPSEMTTKWFRTRWAALGWFFRLCLVPLAAINAFVLVGAIVTGTWGSVITGLSGLALAAVIADWQYWVVRSRLEGPFAQFGAAFSGELRRAQDQGYWIVTLRREGDGWTVYRDE